MVDLLIRPIRKERANAITAKMPLVFRSNTTNPFA
jgi:hypothetical protein